jgi:hypothetical protein
MSKEFLKMQKLASLITESQYKRLIENKQGDKVEGGYVLASPNDNDIADADFGELLKLCKGATKDNFLIISKTEPDGDVSYSGKQLIDLIKKDAAEIICQDKVNEIEGDPPEYYGYNEPYNPEAEADGYGDDKFDIIDNLVDRDLYDNFINAVEAIQDVTVGKEGIEPQDVYDYLTNSMLRDA